jgi:two-component system cell cycle response regulator DivK
MTATILHVEDNPANRMIVRDLLHFRGYRVVEALDGNDALAAAERERPDVILMDIQLPGVSGLEAARRIKAREDLRHIPIVAVTSFALSGDDKRAFAAGCSAYITKPYNPRELVKLIQTLLLAPRADAQDLTPRY